MGLPVSGFDRKHLLKNIVVAIKLLKSMYMANKIIADFKPDVVVGVGGYASGPTASRCIERYSYAHSGTELLPGVTNKMLADKAVKICVAYEGLEKYFPKEKIVITGNPCRQDLTLSEENRRKGIEFFVLIPKENDFAWRQSWCETLNESIIGSFPKIEQADDVQVIWQCGKYYYDNIKQLQTEENPRIFGYMILFRRWIMLTQADLIISRAGAGSISEFCLLGNRLFWSFAQCG